ncbi:MAG TPA: 2-oxoacid:ferredoxin oxidoreductase subunit beta [Thermoplasmatales archaeon]|nr:2-oxoacid:ferredoxin oxidoreductase subunit beta [Thermoplasmatales archaeon]
MDGLDTGAENTWCPGCGNFGILRAVKKAVQRLEETGVERDRLVICAGIGCHGKIFDYLHLSGLYSLHGRSVAAVSGMKMANPELRPIAFVGDGDAYGEGLAHLLFAAKRNMDVTVLVHNNGVYALTTGQFTPTTARGARTRSSPRGNVEEPFHPLALLLEAGATLVARGYPGRLDHLAELIVQAVQHPGFAMVDILQPCVTFHDTYKEYNKKVEVLEEPLDYPGALVLARERDRLPIGIFYRTEKPVYHRELHGDLHPIRDSLSRKQRWQLVQKLLSGETNE